MIFRCPKAIHEWLREFMDEPAEAKREEITLGTLYTPWWIDSSSNLVVKNSRSDVQPVRYKGNKKTRVEVLAVQGEDGKNRFQRDSAQRW